MRAPATRFRGMCSFWALRGLMVCPPSLHFPFTPLPSHRRLSGCVLHQQGLWLWGKHVARLPRGARPPSCARRCVLLPGLFSAPGPKPVGAEACCASVAHRSLSTPTGLHVLLLRDELQREVPEQAVLDEQHEVGAADGTGALLVCWVQRAVLCLTVAQASFAATARTLPARSS